MTASLSLSRRSAVELRNLIRDREVTPLEVLEAHLSAIAKYNAKFNAIVTLVEEQARQAALAAGNAIAAGSPLGPLHGLPVVIKDVTLTKGIRTTFGSPLYKDFVPDEDAAVVARLRKAGAIILGKTNTPEFATGANTVNELFGATRNPWNPQLSPAGSSGTSCPVVMYDSGLLIFVTTLSIRPTCGASSSLVKIMRSTRTSLNRSIARARHAARSNWSSTPPGRMTSTISSGVRTMYPVRPTSTSSGTLPIGYATTGQPDSIASISTSPNGSFHSIGASNARASRSNGTFESSPIRPR